MANKKFGPVMLAIMFLAFGLMLTGCDDGGDSGGGNGDGVAAALTVNNCPSSATYDINKGGFYGQY